MKKKINPQAMQIADYLHDWLEPDAFSQNQKFLTFFCINCHNRIVV